MSPSLQAFLAAAQYNNCVSLAIMIATGYDYILVFSKEIEYIWSKPWTWVSTMFIFVRYLGLYEVIVSALMGSSLMPGSTKTPELEGEVFANSMNWIYTFFLFAADVTMILRMWAMYNRPMLIFVMLSVMFLLEIGSQIVYSAIYSTPEYAQVIQVPGHPSCPEQQTLQLAGEFSTIFPMIFGALLCLLAVVRFIKELVQMYRVTKQWQLNRYMNLLVNQGILYFLAFFLQNLIGLLAYTRTIPRTGWIFALAGIMELVPVYTLTPRFIISIRELHDVQGRHGGIDDGFGLSMTSSRGDGAGRPLMFGNTVENEFIEMA